jgi:hypothetical protein
MVNARRCARLGMIAVGFCIGAGMASTPGVASADGLDFQISIDGYDLFPTTGNLATATSGMGDIAIAFGDGASASATGGTGDFAVDIGNNTDESDGAIALGSGNTAVDIGNNSGVSDQIIADEGTGNTAIDIGNNSGLSDQVAAFEGTGNTAIDIGNNSGPLTRPSRAMVTVTPPSISARMKASPPPTVTITMPR